MADRAGWSRPPSPGPGGDSSDSSSTAPANRQRHLHRRVGRVVGASLAGLLLACGCSTAPIDGGIDKAGGTVTPAPLNLRLANTGGSEGTYDADPFVRQVAELSHGALTLTVDPKLAQPTLTNEPDALRAAQSGQVDIAIVPTRSFDALGVKVFDALMDPLLVDSLSLQDVVLADPVTHQMLDGLTSSGLVGVGVLPGPIRLPNGITRRMLGPATYAGARIAVNASPISEQALRALGAVPVVSAFGGADLTGFDGLEQQASSIAGNQYDRIVRWITTNVGLWPRALAIVASAGAWGRLTETQRGWLVQAADGARSDSTNQGGLEDITNMCRRSRIAVVSASAAEIDQLRRAFAPVDAWLRSDVTTAGYLDRIQAIKQQRGDAPSGQPVDCAALVRRRPQNQTSGPGAASYGPSPVPAGPASKIDGNYQMLTTREDLAAGGASLSELAPANWGDERWVFDRGRFASTQSSSAGSGATVCTWNYGTYDIHDGQVLGLTMLGGGGDQNANRPGEVFDYAVSTYRDTLTLSPVPGAESPLTLRVKPWRRQPTTSWTEFLDHRCLPPAVWDG